MKLGTRLIITCFLSATRAISRPIGPVIVDIIHKADRERFRSCSASRPRAQLRFFTTESSSNLRRLRRPSELVIPRVGDKRERRSRNRAGQLMLSLTRKFPVPRVCCRGRKKFLASRRARPLLPDFSNSATQTRLCIHSGKFRKGVGL